MNKNGQVEIHIRIDRSQVAALDDFSRRAACSRSEAIRQCIAIGLDGEKVGLDSMQMLAEKWTQTLSSLRALVAESVTSSDTTAALQVLQMAHGGVIEKDKMISTFTGAREMARAQLKPAKKTS